MGVHGYTPLLPLWVHRVHGGVSHRDVMVLIVTTVHGTLVHFSFSVCCTVLVHGRWKSCVVFILLYIWYMVPDDRDGVLTSWYDD